MKQLAGTAGDDSTGPGPVGGTSRRALLAGAGAAAVVVLGGCATYDQTGGSATEETIDDVPLNGSSPSSGSSPAPLAQTSEIPVGGGKIIDRRRIVITQPEAGKFVAFTAVCTHQGCTVSEVKSGTINCACHGSRFKVADGTVDRGPARAGLKPIDIAVDGTNITLA